MKAEDVILLVDSTIEDLENQAKAMWLDALGFNSIKNEQMRYDLVGKIRTNDGF